MASYTEQLREMLADYYADVDPSTYWNDYLDTVEDEVGDEAETREAQRSSGDPEAWKPPVSVRWPKDWDEPAPEGPSWDEAAGGGLSNEELRQWGFTSRDPVAKWWRSDRGERTKKRDKQTGELLAPPAPGSPEYEAKVRELEWALTPHGMGETKRKTKTTPVYDPHSGELRPWSDFKDDPSRLIRDAPMSPEETKELRDYMAEVEEMLDDVPEPPKQYERKPGGPKTKLDLKEIHRRVGPDGKPEPLKEHREQLAKDRPGLHNILQVLAKATPEEIDYYRNWYGIGHIKAAQLAERYSQPLDLVCGVIAVLSQQTDWDTNLFLADRALAHDWKNVKNVYEARKKAYDLVIRHDFGAIAGPKIFPFYLSLLDPVATQTEVVIDTHAFMIWRGIRSGKTGGSIDPVREQVVADYAEAGRLHKLTPQAVQAITWMIWRQYPTLRKRDPETGEITEWATAPIVQDIQDRSQWSKGKPWPAPSPPPAPGSEEALEEHDMSLEEVRDLEEEEAELGESGAPHLVPERVLMETTRYGRLSVADHVPIETLRAIAASHGVCSRRTAARYTEAQLWDQLKKNVAPALLGTALGVANYGYGGMQHQQQEGDAPRYARWINAYEGDLSDDESPPDLPKQEPAREEKKLPVEKGAGAQNIITVAKDATPEEVDYWSRWYFGAHDVVDAMADRYELPLETVAGVVAVLSPGSLWRNNVAQAKRIIEWWADRKRGGPFATDRPTYAGPGLKPKHGAGKRKRPRWMDERPAPRPYKPEELREVGPGDFLMSPTEDTDERSEAAERAMYWEDEISKRFKVPEGGKETVYIPRDKPKKEHPMGFFGPTPASYPANVEKALGILDSNDPGAYVKGPKVTVFFESLIDPEQMRDHITLDGHAINIWRGEKKRLQGGTKSVPQGERAQMEDDYADAAAYLKEHESGFEDLTVQGLQALTWYVWKMSQPIAKEKDPVEKAAWWQRAAAPGEGGLFDADELFGEGATDTPEAAPGADEELAAGDAFKVGRYGPTWTVVKAYGASGMVQRSGHKHKWFGYEHNRDTGNIAVYPIKQGSGERIGDPVAFGPLERIGQDTRLAYKQSPLGKNELTKWLDYPGTATFISAARPGSIKTNKNRSRELMEAVKALGIPQQDIRSMQGVWEGAVEPSIAIRGLSLADALQLGRQYGQEAFIHKDESGIPAMYQGYRDEDFAAGKEPSVTIPSKDGEPLYGSQALKVQQAERGTDPLMSKTRGSSFEFLYDWGDPNAVLQWDLSTPVSRASVEEVYVPQGPPTSIETPEARQVPAPELADEWGDVPSGDAAQALGDDLGGAPSDPTRQGRRHGRRRLAWHDQLPGGLADDKTPADFDPETLAHGREVEQEHAECPALATEIALDHLVEEEQYYDKLKIMEETDLETLEALSDDRRDEVLEEGEDRQGRRLLVVAGQHSRPRRLRAVRTSTRASDRVDPDPWRDPAWADSDAHLRHTRVRQSSAPAAGHTSRQHARQGNEDALSQHQGRGVRAGEANQRGRSCHPAEVSKRARWQWYARQFTGAGDGVRGLDPNDPAGSARPDLDPRLAQLVGRVEDVPPPGTVGTLEIQVVQRSPSGDEYHQEAVSGGDLENVSQFVQAYGITQADADPQGVIGRGPNQMELRVRGTDGPLDEQTKAQVLGMIGQAGMAMQAFRRTAAAWLKRAISFDESDIGAEYLVTGQMVLNAFGGGYPLQEGMIVKLDGYHPSGQDEYNRLDPLQDPVPGGSPIENMRVRLLLPDGSLAIASATELGPLQPIGLERELSQSVSEMPDLDEEELSLTDHRPPSEPTRNERAPLPPGAFLPPVVPQELGGRPGTPNDWFSQLKTWPNRPWTDPRERAPDSLLRTPKPRPGGEEGYGRPFAGRLELVTAYGPQVEWEGEATEEGLVRIAAQHGLVADKARVDGEWLIVPSRPTVTPDGSYRYVLHARVGHATARVAARMAREA